MKLKNVFFNSLLYWMAAYDYFHISSFHDFFIFFLFLVRCFSYMHTVYLGASFGFKEIQLLIKKKKILKRSWKQVILFSSYNT